MSKASLQSPMATIGTNMDDGAAISSADVMRGWANSNNHVCRNDVCSRPSMDASVSAWLVDEATRFDLALLNASCTQGPHMCMSVKRLSSAKNPF